MFWHVLFSILNPLIIRFLPVLEYSRVYLGFARAVSIYLLVDLISVQIHASAFLGFWDEANEFVFQVLSIYVLLSFSRSTQLNLHPRVFRPLSLKYAASPADTKSHHTKLSLQIKYSIQKMFQNSYKFTFA